MHASVVPAVMDDDLEHLIQTLAQLPPPKTVRHIVIMSNAGFGGIHGRLVAAIEARR